MTTDNFCFYFQNRLIQISQTGGPSICLPLHPFVCLSTCLPNCRYIRPSICLSVGSFSSPSVCLSIRISSDVHISACPSVCLPICSFIYLFVRTSVRLSVHSPFHLSVPPSDWLISVGSPLRLSDYLSVCISIRLPICIFLSFFFHILYLR